MDKVIFIEKFKAIFSDATDESAEATLADWTTMAQDGTSPASSAETSEAVNTLFEEVKASIPGTSDAPVDPDTAPKDQPDDNSSGDTENKTE